MQEVFEKIIEKLEEELNLEDEEKSRCARENPMQFDSAKGYAYGVANSIEIVRQAAKEYNNGWISCSERLPERDGAYQLKEFEVTVDNGERMYTSHATYDFHNKKWLVHKKKVIAWKHPCEPYQPKGE